MTTSRFEFGPYTLDVATGIVRGKDGEVVRINRKARLVLQALLQAGGAVVPKVELMKAAWPNVTVVDRNLSVQIVDLRHRLPDVQNLIANVPGVGYQLRQLEDT